MLPKAHLTSHSSMCGSRWVITPLWLSRSLLLLSFTVPIIAWNVSLVSPTILPFWVSFSWGLFWPLPPVQCHEPLSIVLQALYQSPWIYLSLPLYNHKEFKSYWMGSSGFPYFLQVKSEFCNREFMIWVIVSSQSCFCWLYGASPSSAAKNVINLVSVLAIWWCLCVESSPHMCCWKRVLAMTSAFSWQNAVSLCSASFCILRPNLPVTSGSSWLLTFAFQSPIMKSTSFFWC